MYYYKVTVMRFKLRFFTDDLKLLLYCCHGLCYSNFMHKSVNCKLFVCHVTCTLFRKHSLLAKDNLKFTRVAHVLITKWPHVCSLSQSTLLATCTESLSWSPDNENLT